MIFSKWKETKLEKSVMNVVLVEPEIPPNTGNVARLCAATNCVLHLVEPLGFRLDDRTLKRAGMDYWRLVTWHLHKSLADLQEKVRRTQKSGSRTPKPTFYYVSPRGTRLYTEPRYQESDYLIFGRESIGLPEEILRTHSGTTIRIPMWNEQARSLNLATAVAIVLYEALRQVRA